MKLSNNIAKDVPVRVTNAGHELSFRKEIDGLRAIAVLGVIFYHSGLGCPGGFVGVDVFFVISGFLLTRIIFTELNAGTFSIIIFFERRVRRIFPASAVMCLACLAMGYWLMLPVDFDKLGQSALWQVGLASNLYFWRDTGYFASGVSTKPLLHTWSLALEEQFYLVLPFFLIVVHRFAKRAILPILIIMAIALFSLNLVTISKYPSATFYLLPTRAWELLVGSIIAVRSTKAKERRYVQEALGMIGLLAIFGYVFLMDDKRPFPGWLALIPVLGCGLIIDSSSGSQTWVGRLLSIAPMRIIGKLSYALYLWHWPLFAFSKYAWDGELSTSWTIAMILLTFLLAWLSLVLVEDPIRKKERFASRKNLGWMFGTAVAGLAAISFSIFWTQGIPERVTQELRESKKEVFARLSDLKKGDLPAIGDSTAQSPSFLIWGDSHAGVARPVFDEVAKELRLAGLAANIGGSPPIPDVKVSWNPDLVDWNRRVLEFIRANGIQQVYLIARWANYVEGSTDYDVSQGALVNAPLLYVDNASSRSRASAYELFGENLLEMCDALLSSGVKVIIFEQVPEQDFDPLRREFVSTRTLRWIAPIATGTTRSVYRERQARVAKIFDQLESRGVEILRFEEEFFGTSDYCKTADSGRILYRDSQHLSRYGAQRVFQNPIRRILLASEIPK